jgi:hypothetical protein
MKIERVIIRDLRALKSRDDTFVGPDGVFSAACLRGLNGCGKTTYLEALAQLWQWFRRCSQRRAWVAPSTDSTIMDAGLVAVLFTDLPGPRSRMWVAWGRADLLKEHVVGTPDSPHVVNKDGIQWVPEVLDWWDQQHARAAAGAVLLPNFVFIEAENKFVPELRRNELSGDTPAPVFLPVGRHAPGARGGAHLEGIMRTLFLVRPERWEILVRAFGRLRPGLTLLNRFDEATQRPLFTNRDGVILTVSLLSAGERSVLINLCMVLRWLGPGGIVLIDEPELHQHLSLMRGSIAVTEALIAKEFWGQLLVASHAPEVWDHFRMTGALIDLDPVGKDS